MGKGDKRRPTVVDEKKFEDRWAKAFASPEAETTIVPNPENHCDEHQRVLPCLPCIIEGKREGQGPEGDTDVRRFYDADLNPNAFDSKREDEQC